MKPTHDGDESVSVRAILSDPTRGSLVHVLDDVDALEGAVLGGHAAGDLDVAVDDGEEGDAEGGTSTRPKVTRFQKTVRSETSPNHSQST